MLGCDHTFDLENPRDLAALENPQLAMENLTGVILIDEVQRKPEMFPLLRYLIDQKRDQKFLILGSASRELLQNSSESLAGRIQYVDLFGFNLLELGVANLDDLWIRGGFPRSYLAASLSDSYLWRRNFIRDYLERDIPLLGIRVPSPRLRRFWIMLSHFHGHLANYSELARSMDLSEKTIKHYIDILASTFMVAVLQPWHSNTKKRLVKSPKIYLRDTGIFNYLQSIETNAQLISHPKLGASWESFAMFNFQEILGLDPRNMFFWAVHGRGELDLYWQDGGRGFGAEFKYGDAPKMTKTLKFVKEELNPLHIWVVYPGDKTYPLSEGITAIPLTACSKEMLNLSHRSTGI
jgi:uncharacterized protein